MTAPWRRRCLACLRVIADHAPARLGALGFAPHEFDPGERRAGEGLPRAEVWSHTQRQRHRRRVAA